MIFAQVSQTDLWKWHFHIDTWLLVFTLLAAYFLAIKHMHGRYPDPTTKQKISFVAGVITIWIASDYPLHDFAEKYLFSVHMVQHLLITLVAPPLLIAGLSNSMLRAMFCRGHWHKIFKVVFSPVFATIFFSATTVLTHWPVIVNAALTHHWLHFIVHVWVFSAAWAMWMPVFSRVPELPTMTTPMKLIYLFIQSIIPTVPAAFITFADHPVYSFYENVPRIWPQFDAVQDQQLAGAIMKVFGGGVLWVVIGVLFFRWQGEDDDRPKYEHINAEKESALAQASAEPSL